MIQGKNKIQLEVKVHTWLEGQWKPNSEDVFRRIAQHLYNNAIQRKRPIGITKPTNVAIYGYMSLELDANELAILNDTKILLRKIDKISTVAKELNVECAKLTDRLSVILEKYVSEIPDTE